MTLLDTLKSLLGLGSQDSRSESRGEAGVTVEREPGGAPEPVSSPDEPDHGDESHDADDEPSAGPTGTDEEPEAEPAEEETDDTDDEGEEAAAEEPAAGTDEPTDELEGIGPAYAERLSEAGVETVADLAAADLDALAEEADVPEGRLETWIDRAKDR
jgi:predicted flap endonuclease-1-like 5' DNA nuclease